ncbi:hypothetical protein D3C84_1050690 [compost metagenome]
MSGLVDTVILIALMPHYHQPVAFQLRPAHADQDDSVAFDGVLYSFDDLFLIAIDQLRQDSLTPKMPRQANQVLGGRAPGNQCAMLS